MTLKISEFLKISGMCLEINLSSYKKILLFFLSYDTNKFWIAHEFLDSNATLLPGFFSLCLHPNSEYFIREPDRTCLI